MLVLLTGGARSGKSTAAGRAAAATGLPVTFVATASPGDAEMAARIERHCLDRPNAWTVVEEPTDLIGAVSGVDPTEAVIIDCLGLWVTNCLDLDDAVLADLAAVTADALVARTGPTFVVTNEVGSGIVPDNELARRFRDLLGLVNQRFAHAADTAYLCVAGRLLALSDPAASVAGGPIRPLS